MYYELRANEMSDSIVRIEALENGFNVCVINPKIQAENQKPKSNWKDPWVAYAFKTSEEVCEFLEQVLDKLAPPSDDKMFADAFKSAVEEAADED